MNEKQARVVNELMESGWHFENHNTEWQKLLSELTVTLIRFKHKITVDGEGNTRTPENCNTLLRNADINSFGNEKTYVAESRRSILNNILQNVYLPSYITTGY